MKIPGPDHPITVEPNPNRITVTFNGETIADTTRSHSLKETSYPVVHYIPRQDVNMALLERTDHTTHCPYKGGAAYWNIKVGDKKAENAAWSYEDPYPTVVEIKGYLAFYTAEVPKNKTKKFSLAS